MREVKFRAWDEHDKKMWNPDEVVVWNNNFYINPKKKLESKIYGWSHSEKLIMQFTGLKDKNGVEIYEGDCFKGKSGIKIVKYKDGAFVTEYKFNIRGFKEVNISPLIVTSRESVVIGNIYENPELLETKKSS